MASAQGPASETDLDRGSEGEAVNGRATSAEHPPAPDSTDDGGRDEADAPAAPSPKAGSAELVARAHELIETGYAILVVPSEVFLHFHPAGPEQVINACRAAGFRELQFELVGDELVAFEYLRLWQENRDKETWLRSTHPLVVEYCRARHPELLRWLAPVVTPAAACARYLRRLHAGSAEEVRLVYAGLDAPTPAGHEEYDLALSFLELQLLLEQRDAPPAEQPLLLRSVPPTRERYVSAAGGLPLPMLDAERASSRHFRKLRGLHTLAGLSKLLSEGGNHLGFVDVLPFEGPLEHPSLGPREQFFWRRELMELAEAPRADAPVVRRPPELDLSVTYEPRPIDLSEVELQEVEKTLAEVGASANGSYWRDDPRGFATYLSLADSLLRVRPELSIGLFHMTRTYAKALRDATHDALTNLYSYRALVERVEEELGQANRAGSTLALLFVDLDAFKAINDRHGHPVGNEFLRAVAEILSDTIRSTDIAGRFGGDEFVVLLVDSDAEGAARVAEEIRQRVSRLEVSVPGGEARTTCSIGIALYSGRDESLDSADDLFAEADASLYIAKAHGGNRVHPALREELSG